MKSGREIAFYHRLCINCGDCKAVCPEDAISLEDTGRIIRDRCTACGKCAEACPTTALKIVGKHYSVSNLIEILLSDHIFYETSKGGVTFSGGEPTLYMDYVGEVMKELKANNIHIAIETSGMFNLDEFKTKLLPYINLIYYDIKLYDPRKHEQYTGKSNKQILSNLTDFCKGAKRQNHTKAAPCAQNYRNNRQLDSDSSFPEKCRNYHMRTPALQSWRNSKKNRYRERYPS